MLILQDTFKYLMTPANCFKIVGYLTWYQGLGEAWMSIIPTPSVLHWRTPFLFVPP